MPRPTSCHSSGGQIANVLAAVHAKGIVHRDLKLDNVFLESKHGAQAQVRILDFGIAKLVGPDVVGLTKSGQSTAWIRHPPTSRPHGGAGLRGSRPPDTPW